MEGGREGVFLPLCCQVMAWVQIAVIVHHSYNKTTSSTVQYIICQKQRRNEQKISNQIISLGYSSTRVSVPML